MKIPEPCKTSWESLYMNYELAERLNPRLIRRTTNLRYNLELGPKVAVTLRHLAQEPGTETCGLPWGSHTILSIHSPWLYIRYVFVMFAIRLQYIRYTLANLFQVTTNVLLWDYPHFSGTGSLECMVLYCFANLHILTACYDCFNIRIINIKTIYFIIKLNSNDCCTKFVSLMQQRCRFR